MCRIYGLRASTPTGVRDDLVRAPHSLLVQSRGDLRGFSHADGWGIAAYTGSRLGVRRRHRPAYDGSGFRKTARRAGGRTVLAHVRRATHGGPRQENTHPFRFGEWTFLHNGTITRFRRLRDRMLAGMSPRHREAVRGDTDSEHFFHWAMTGLLSEPAAETDGNAADPAGTAPERPGLDRYREIVERLVRWRGEVGLGRAIGLNTLLTDGDRILGTRWKRSLWYARRGEPAAGRRSGRPAEGRARAVVIASEPLSGADEWRPVPERSAFEVGPGLEMAFAPLRRRGARYGTRV